jgi:hypothetical protein
MLPLIIVFQKRLGYSIKKGRGQMSHSEKERDLEAQVFLKFFKFSKRGI